MHAVVHSPVALAAGTRPPAPTVVLESGLGLSRLLWVRVVPLLTRHGVRVVVYDRAGLGRSPATSGTRTADDLVGDLHHVLTSLAPRGVVLVGHSYGALITRIEVARHPSLVRGLVLVDPSTENVLAETTPTGRALDRLTQRALEGLYRLGGGRPALMSLGFKDLPARMRRKVLAEDADAATARARGQELAGYVPTLLDLAHSPLPVPSIPVVLLAARDLRDRSCWTHSYRSFVASLPSAALRFADTRSHMVPLRDPQSVADAILEVIAW